MSTVPNINSTSEEKTKAIEKSLFDNFCLNIMKILSEYTTMQRAIGPLLKRDEQFIGDYKSFVSLSKRYEREFFPKMFQNWAQTITMSGFIFDECIEIRLSSHNLLVNLPIIHEWGLRIAESKYIKNLEIILLQLAALYHKDEAVTSELKARLAELQPKLPNRTDMANLPAMIQQLAGGVDNMLKSNPEFKEQMPEGFDLQSMMTKLSQGEAMSKVMDSVKDGTWMGKFASGEFLTDIMKDDQIKALMNMDKEKKPTSFAELPVNLQPPGEPIIDSPNTGSSSSTPSGSTPSTNTGSGATIQSSLMNMIQSMSAQNPASTAIIVAEEIVEME